MAGLLGQSLREAIARFGPARADQRTGTDRWLVFASPEWSLRIRLRPGPQDGSDFTIRSWTLSFTSPRPIAPQGTVAVLAEIGLPEPPSHVARDAFRMPLAEQDGVINSLTIKVGPGGVLAVTAFDEPPDWEDPPTR